MRKGVPCGQGASKVERRACSLALPRCRSVDEVKSDKSKQIKQKEKILNINYHELTINYPLIINEKLMTNYMEINVERRKNFE